MTEVFIRDLLSRAKELAVYDLRPFYQSSLFKQLGFVVQESRGVITKTYDLL